MSMNALLDFVYQYQPSTVIGWEDWVFVPVKRFVAKIGSEMTYNVSSRTLNHILSLYLPSYLLVCSLQLLTNGYNNIIPVLLGPVNLWPPAM